MPVRHGEATWLGTSRQGKGTVKVGSGLFETPYTWAGRFADEPGTNPEELIAAAHSGCFSMALASDLTKAGYPPNRIHTTAAVTIERAGEGWEISGIALDTEAEVPGIDSDTFQKVAEGARKGCPVSKALAAVTITLNARLV